MKADVNSIVKHIVTKTTWSKVVSGVEDNIEEWDVEADLESQVCNFVDLCRTHTRTNTRQFEARIDFRPYFDSELRKLIKKKHKTRGEEKRKLRKEIRCLLRRKKRKARTEFCSRGLQDRSGKMLWSTFRKSRGQNRKME